MDTVNIVTRVSTIQSLSQDSAGNVTYYMLMRYYNDGDWPLLEPEKEGDPVADTSYFSHIVSVTLPKGSPVPAGTPQAVLGFLEAVGF